MTYTIIAHRKSTGSRVQFDADFVSYEACTEQAYQLIKAGFWPNVTFNFSPLDLESS